MTNLLKANIILSGSVILRVFFLSKKWISSVFSILKLIEYFSPSLTNKLASLSKILIFFLKLLEKAINTILSMYDISLIFINLNKSRIYIKNKISEIRLP